MRSADDSRLKAELDSFIHAYEAARAAEPTDLGPFLPATNHPLYGAVLLEIVRIDLEYGWATGRPRPLEEYERSFPDLFRDRESLRAIAYEEYRLRRQAGEDAEPAEYARRLGVEVTSWPNEPLSEADNNSATAARGRKAAAGEDRRFDPARLPGDAAAYVERFRDHLDQAVSADAQPREPVEEAPPSRHADPFDVAHMPDPLVAAWQTQAIRTIHPAGGEFVGFQLLAELGSGAFARVYLCRQADLADRFVVLKIAPRLLGESRTLARLLHPNIVPIYSVHRTRQFQAVCMPFLGRTTLADVLKDLRTLPVLPGSARYLINRIDIRARESIGAVEPPPRSNELDSAAPVVALANLNYVDGVLWIGMLLADGLAHAHGQGIIHRDLKPANVLLADTGQPVLLDFNLSEDSKLQRSAVAARVGGTLPYMAPEQLIAYLKDNQQCDERSDLYSFGIVLYELLTGGHAVERHTGPTEVVLRKLIAERLRPPSVRRWNRAVSPGAESIVRHCLEPDPSRRYQSARELSEDLQRYFAHRPLFYAPDPSRRERWRKWRTRHPRLSTGLGVAVVAAALLLAVGGTLGVRIRGLARARGEQEARQMRLTAVAAQRALHDDLRLIEFLVGSNVTGAEAEQRAEWIELVTNALERHAVLDTASWSDGPLMRALAPNEQEQVRNDMGELLLLATAADARQRHLEGALRLSSLAAGCYPQGRVPQAVWRQRADLLRSAGRAEEAARLAELADNTPGQSPRDRYLSLLTEFQSRGRLPKDLPLLIEARSQKRDNFAVWLILGNSYVETGKRVEAMECFDMAAALQPDSHWPFLCGGMVCLEMRNYQKARESFDEVIRLNPSVRGAYYDRALASYHLGDYVDADADLTHVLADPRPPLRAYFLRARVRLKEGDRAGGLRDRDQGLVGEPRDERDWTARGLERQALNPERALAEFDAALKINPSYRTALQNKANVLAEHLGRTADAIAALDALLRFFPTDVPARASRGVLHARLGHREAAHADAHDALQMDNAPFIAYQVAGIYALTSRQNPEDRREALRLLAVALGQGTGLDLLDRDRDLDAIRNDPDFRRLVQEARARRKEASPVSTKLNARSPGRLPAIPKVAPVSR
jgi:eukaryotic-like serine/threonine-protein kinase